MPAPELRICLDESDLDAALRLDAKRGLTSHPKHLPMRLHYDGRGSAMFGELTRQPEYYQTRSERAILRDNAASIAGALGEAPISVIELGAGRAEKIRPILDAIAEQGRLDAFWPFDVAEGEVRDVLLELATAYPDAYLGGIVGDFTRHLQHLPDHHDTRLVAFLGGTFGNFTGMERSQFLRDLREALRPGDWFLLGADLVKDPEVILAAYNDAAGVTAEFNRNVLYVLNHRLDADFQPDNFEHIALWDNDTATIDMRLRAMKPMAVDLSALSLDVSFSVGEEIHTGISTKFHRGELENQLQATGFEPAACWTDERGYMGVFLARAL
ncbi:L-histidine N(alpha)-methyltransferase [Glycomyces harbinensis]|uniref:L-histidine Nalpha-methyltransferase n=1 Tax=Glycomyces harbinensis TaxID=58114 RepID=A0A1G7CAL8_9ACTN|nr:L-histidine N(alpha)-methyltransferase [Glycomyces harbinensis]SDE36414.1 L-histidine Nalpha-methyltransferase [Glycomyces harbinensis]